MNAQTVGPRLYLRFEDNKGELFDYIGIRIRPNVSSDNYWVLGGAYRITSTYAYPKVKYSYSLDCSELNNSMYSIQLITEYNTSSVVFPVLK